MKKEDEIPKGRELEDPIKIVTEITLEVAGTIQSTNKIVLKVKQTHSTMNPEERGEPASDKKESYSTASFYKEYESSMNKVEKEIKIEVRDEKPNPQNRPMNYYKPLPCKKEEAECNKEMLRDRSPVSEKERQERDTVIKELKSEIQTPAELEILNRRERSLKSERPWDNQLRGPAETITEPIESVKPLVTLGPVRPLQNAVDYYNQGSPFMDDSSNEGALQIATSDEENEEENEETEKSEKKHTDQPEQNFWKANNSIDAKSIEMQKDIGPDVALTGSAPSSNKELDNGNKPTNAEIVNKLMNADAQTNSTDYAEINKINAVAERIRLSVRSRAPPSRPPTDVFRFNWRTYEGFYSAKAGEVLISRYTVYYAAGTGAFSSVVRAKDHYNANADVAIKIIRKHSSTFNMGIKELEVFKILRNADRHDLFHCLRCLNYFIHRGHLCLVLEPMTMNFACYINLHNTPYNTGMDMKCVQHFVPQLFLALKLLKCKNIIHTDIKPENILLDYARRHLKLGDFGSAITQDNPAPTSYLVSRYYRAPEVIMGAGYNHGIDIWSAGCTIYEMITGKKMFKAATNNHMIKKIMEYGGKLPNEMILHSKFGSTHFTKDFEFKLVKYEDTLKEGCKVLPIIKRNRNLQAEITPHPPILLTRDQAKKCRQLRDLLERMLCLDPNKRATIEGIIGHSFIFH